MSLNSAKNINLSPGQARFALLIDPYPKFSVYWDWAKKECNPEAIKNALPSMSHGEQIMLKFFLSVWLHKDQGFDFIEAANILDDEQVRVVTEWMAEPFWP